MEISKLFSGVPEAKICVPVTQNPVPAMEITQLCTDSRRVIPGALFFAIDGLRTAGTTYALDAVKRGAVAIVTQQNLAEIPANIEQIVVPNVLEIIPRVAANFFGDGDAAFPLVGVTGTNGKTSVTSIVRWLLMRQSARPWGLIGTVRYELGARSIPSYKTTPEALDLAGFFHEMRRANCAGCVMEVSSHAICQNRICGLNFDVAAFTNLTQDHIDYHGTMDNYFAAKKLLFIDKNGLSPKNSVINIDDARGHELAGTLRERGAKVITFGIHGNADFRASDVELSSAGTRFRLDCPAGTFEIRTQLPGFYNVSNVLCALAILFAMGEKIVPAIANLADFSGVPGRMERVPAPENSAFPFQIFVDYAHTDDALTNALSMLKSIAKSRIFCVFGCGGNRDRGKRPKMVRAVQALADFAWATADNPRNEPLEQIFADMRTGVSVPEKIVFEPDRRRAIALAIDAAGTNDIILIAGKGHETYQIFSDITLPFDDKQVAQELLNLKAHRVA